MDEILQLLGGLKIFVDYQIYTPQEIENGIKFGTKRNTVGASVCEITKEEDGFRIKLTKIKKAKYNKATNMFLPPEKIVKYNKGGIQSDELLSTFTSLCR